MKLSFRKSTWIVAFVCTLTTVGHSAIPTNATKSLLDTRPGLKALYEGERLVAFYGAPLAEDSDPATTTDQFVSKFLFTDGHKDALGVDDIGLVFQGKTSINNGKIVYAYQQTIGGIPVFSSYVRVLVLPGSTDKITYVGASVIVPPPTFPPDTVTTSSQAMNILSGLPEYQQLTTFTDPERIIFKTADGTVIRAWRFIGAGEADEFEFILNSATEELASVLDAKIGADVGGQVKGVTTENPTATPNLQPIPKANIGLFETAGPVGECGIAGLIDEEPTGSGGNFTLNTDFFPVRARVALESDLVTVVTHQFPIPPPSPICQDVVQATTQLELEFSDSPSTIDPQGTAHVNAYLGIHRAHNFWKEIQPASTAGDQHVLASVNAEPSCGTGGAASGVFGIPTITFWGYVPPLTSPGCQNAAFSTIISHEYMHIIQAQMFGSILHLGSFREGYPFTVQFTDFLRG